MTTTVNTQLGGWLALGPSRKHSGQIAALQRDATLKWITTMQRWLLVELVITSIHDFKVNLPKHFLCDDQTPVVMNVSVCM